MRNLHLFVVLITVLSAPLLSSLYFGFRKLTIGGQPSNIPFFFFLMAIVTLLFPLYFKCINSYFFFEVTLGSWIKTASFDIKWSFIFDPLTYFMFFIVLVISFLVHIYSLSYMHEDPYLARFLSFLSLFTFFMLLLVSSGNLVQLFIGWEGVGLCSFLLISFWTERLAANKAAIKAMVVNKIGDCFYLIGVALFLQQYGSTSFSLFLSDFMTLLYPSLYLNYSIFGYSFDFVTIVGFCFFIGVMTKSAQFGFHTWLPDAMEGPTPVSALIHAATMVTAGVFLLLRMGSFFQFSLSLQYFIVGVGMLTMFFAATVALFQSDIKKVIAYSTCSQLGYMVVACGLSFYGAAFFHLLTHAFFKALLFLGAGAVIHFFNDEQDMRRMGGIFFYTPFTYISMVVASFALLGFPFTSGYYSKDRLLELFYLSNLQSSTFIFFVGIFVACLTSFYSFRLLYFVFINKPAGFKISYFHPHSLDKRMFFVFLTLLLFSIFFGFIYSTYFPFILVFPFDNIVSHFIVVPLFVKFLPLFSIFFGWFVIHSFYYNSRKNFYYNFFLYTLYDFLIKKWYVDILYNYYIVNFVYSASLFSFFAIEKGWIEFLGPTGLSKLSIYISNLINKMQTGNFFDYLFYFILTILCLVIFI